MCVMYCKSRVFHSVQSMRAVNYVKGFLYSFHPAPPPPSNRSLKFPKKVFTKVEHTADGTPVTRSKSEAKQNPPSSLKSASDGGCFSRNLNI